MQVGPEFTWSRWIDRYREGRAFVTNGPLLTFTANGQLPGSVLRENRVRLAAEVTSRVPVDTLELIQNGVVIESTSGARVEKEVTLEQSAWFAVRVSGKPVRGFGNDVPRAHSAPVYVNLAGKPVLIREDLELMIRWLGRFWANLEERNNFGPAPNRSNARTMFDQAITHYEAKLKGL